MDHERKLSSYGPCKSKITAELYASSHIDINEPLFDEDQVCWKESGPKEGGCYGKVRRSPDSSLTEVTPGEFVFRTPAYEYVGGESNYKDTEV
jgi:hypothetical protein